MEFETNIRRHIHLYPELWVAAESGLGFDNQLNVETMILAPGLANSKSASSITVYCSVHTSRATNHKFLHEPP